MTSAELLALRYLLAASLPGLPRRCLFLGVIQDGEGVAVHYFPFGRLSPAAGIAADTLLRQRFAASAYAHLPLALHEYGNMDNLPPVPWSQLDLETCFSVPKLVLVEDDRGVWGCQMGYIQQNSEAEFCDRFAEPEEAQAVVEQLRGLATDEVLDQWAKVKDVEGVSVEAILAGITLPHPHAGHVLVYRDNQWWHGTWGGFWGEDTTPQPLHLTPIAEFYGTRVSKKVRDSRTGLDEVRAGATLLGDEAVLWKAADLAGGSSGPDYGDFESDPGVKLLCTWWNTHAPEPLRCAAAFQLYRWNADDRIFEPGQPEEPAILADSMIKSGPWAWFEESGVLVTFVQSRKAALYEDNDTIILDVAGNREGGPCGMHPDEWDEASDSFLSLQRLAWADKESGELFADDGEMEEDEDDEDEDEKGEEYPFEVSAQYVTYHSEYRALVFTMFGGNRLYFPIHAHPAFAGLADEVFEEMGIDEFSSPDHKERRLTAPKHGFSLTLKALFGKMTTPQIEGTD